MWARWVGAWRPNIGQMTAVPWLDSIRGSVDSYTDAEDYDERINAAVVRRVDESVRGLPAPQRHAIRIKYLNEIGPAVWRSNRIPEAQVRRLAAEAELALVEALRLKDVVL